MIIEITIWEILIIFVLVILYYIFKAALNLVIYKRASQELTNIANKLHTKENIKKKSEKR